MNWNFFALNREKVSSKARSLLISTRLVRYGLLAALLIGFTCWSPTTSRAELVLTVNPDGAMHSGPGVHEVDFFLSHSGDGESTFDGIRFDILNASNATVQQGPVTSDFTGDFFTATVNTEDQLLVGAASQMDTVPDPGTRLATVAFDVLDNEDFTVGLEFVELTRNFETVSDPSPPVLMPSSFTVSAVPEPSSLAMLGGLVAVGAIRLRQKRKTAKCKLGA